MATNGTSSKPMDYLGPDGAKKKRTRMPKRIMRRTNETPLEYLKVMEDIYKDLHDNLKSPAKTYDPKAAAAAVLYKAKMTELVDKEYLRSGSKMDIMTNSLLGTITRAVNGQAIMVIRAARWISYQQDHIDPQFTSNVADPIISLLFGCLGPSPHQVAADLVMQWQRYHEIAHTFGWRYLSILAFSDTFREYALKAAEQKWVEWLNYADDARLSIEVLGSFYCPAWRDILRRGLGGIDMKLFTEDEEMVEYNGHHHLWGFTIENDKVMKAEKIVTYEVIEKAIIRTGLKGALGPDPRDLVKEENAKRCVVCGQAICDCPSHVWAPCLVEIVNVGARGFGVRALQNIQAKQCIGEYIGEIVNAGQALYTPDSYMLRGHLGSKNRPKEANYYVTSNKKGNWTRFVNHACYEFSNCSIDHHEYRGKMYAVYVSRKNIAMYEELTVDYGPGYWGSSLFPCLCGANRHYTDKNTYK
ncbi:uncharacterized protein H6S33_005237 [Morchella sextelata]|uniref:uncharacterized protein n=1 Tax=Morchella sextelata TaxID=1174677 RepID=UPI001D04CA91|nr:uncharacterized protein H6S33_005237 [Morchella sextelata]KAH0605255.1 hypothetical protein H6S33_005237 [Morchella sextelata]